MLSGTLPEEGVVCEETRPFFAPANAPVVEAITKRDVLTRMLR